MKNLIKFFVLVFALTMTAEAIAQNFGVKAGLNLSNVVMKDDDGTYSDEFKMNPGFHAGLTAEFPLTELFSFETGLLLSTKGFRTTEETSFMDEPEKYEGKLNLFYLDLPLTARASFDIGGANVYGVFGPYVGMGLSGKSKAEYTYDGETETDEENVRWGSDESKDDLKRLDYGLILGTGVGVNSVEVGLTYGLGLANISPDTEEGFRISHRVLSVSIGYKFNKK